ncbi:hypothetical protein BOX15_Mlig020724g2, partial [Macrostomum lignano]
TNVSGSQIDSQLLRDLTDLLAQKLGKPDSYCTVHISPDQRMAFGGTEDPCGHATLLSLGGLSANLNREISKALADFFSTRLGIPPSRCYIRFIDCQRHELGWNGGTF